MERRPRAFARAESAVVALSHTALHHEPPSSSNPAKRRGLSWSGKHTGDPPPGVSERRREGEQKQHAAERMDNLRQGENLGGDSDCVVACPALPVEPCFLSAHLHPGTANLGQPLSSAIFLHAQLRRRPAVWCPVSPPVYVPAPGSAAAASTAAIRSLVHRWHCLLQQIDGGCTLSRDVCSAFFAADEKCVDEATGGTTEPPPRPSATARNKDWYLELRR